MRKVFVATLALIVTAGAYAQMKPAEGSTGFGLRVNGLGNIGFTPQEATGLSGLQFPSPGGFALPSLVDQIVPQNMITVRHYINENWAFRGGLGINSVNMTSGGGDSTNILGQTGEFTTTTQKTTAFSMGFSIAAERHFEGGEKLDPYLGIRGNMSFMSKVKAEGESVTLGDSLRRTVISESEIDGGIAGGADLFAGFQYFFAQNIAIGAEIFWGFNAARVGGEWASDIETQSGAANSSVISTSISRANGTQEFNRSGFLVTPMTSASLTLNWYFNNN